MPEVFANKRTKSTPPAKQPVLPDNPATEMVDAVTKLVQSGMQRSVWHSLTALPKGVNFEAQNDDENVVLFMRAHPVTNLPWMFAAIVILFIPMIWTVYPLLTGLSIALRMAITTAWYFGLAFFIFQKVVSWFYNVYIVSDERVIDVDFYGLLYKNVKTAPISRLEDVSYTQKGILSSFFDYGNVVVETASEQRSDSGGEGSGMFIFENVPSPNDVVKVISELMEKEEEEHGIKR